MIKLQYYSWQSFKCKKATGREACAIYDHMTMWWEKQEEMDAN